MRDGRQLMRQLNIFGFTRDELLAATKEARQMVHGQPPPSQPETVHSNGKLGSQYTAGD